MFRERERRLVQVLSARGLVLCFRPRFRTHAICYLRLKTTNRFAFFTPFCGSCFRAKNSRYDAVMLCMDDTLYEENDFSSKCCGRRATDNEFPSSVFLSWTTTHADCNQGNKLVLVFVLALGSKSLNYPTGLLPYCLISLAHRHSAIFSFLT